MNLQAQQRIKYLQELRDADPAKYARHIRESCEEVSYPGGTTAYYDDITDRYYNGAGQQLKRPEEYHPDNDGRYY